MPEEFELKGKVVVDASDLEKLPAKAAEVAKKTQSNLASGANRPLAGLTSSRSPQISLLQQRMTAQRRELERLHPGTLQEVGGGGFVLPGRLRTQEAVTSATGALGGTLRNRIMEQDLRVQTLTAGKEKEIFANRLRENAKFTASRFNLFREEARRTGFAVQNMMAQAGRRAEQIPEFDQDERARRRGTGGRSGGLGPGIFRGFATALSQGTGVNVPFLSLSPVFIAGAVAASTLSLALKESIALVNQLGASIVQLRAQTGTSIVETSKLAATARQFGVSAEDTTTGVTAMRGAIAAGSPIFERLGVSLTDSTGKARSAGAVFNDVRDAISQIKDPTLQASAAYDAFGDSYVKLMPLLRQSRGTLDANAEAIQKQTDKGKDVVAQQDEYQQRVVRGGNFLNGILTGFGQKIQASFGTTLKQLDEIGENQKKNTAYLGAYNQAIHEGKTEVEAVAAGWDAQRKIIEQINAEKAAGAGEGAGAAPVLSITTLTATAAQALDAESQALSLNESLLNITLQRQQIEFQIGIAKENFANMQFDMEQQLSNQAQDRAMQLAEQIAALTITLNSFNAAEQSAEIRAREQEKSFFAFRPDNALVRADQEKRYQRDRAQEIARNTRTIDMQNRQLQNQEKVSALQLADLARQEAIVARQEALFNLSHPDVDKQAQTSLNMLAAAVLAYKDAPTKQDIALAISVTSPFFTAEEKARLNDIILAQIGEILAGAIVINRAKPLPGHSHESGPR